MFGARSPPTARRGCIAPRDAGRDQSWFLFATTRAQLAFLRFPLGELAKPAVRRLAGALGLAVADKPDSQDICFVPSGRYTTRHRSPAAADEVARRHRPPGRPRARPPRRGRRLHRRPAARPQGRRWRTPVRRPAGRGATRGGRRPARGPARRRPCPGGDQLARRRAARSTHAAAPAARSSRGSARPGPPWPPACALAPTAAIEVRFDSPAGGGRARSGLRALRSSGRHLASWAAASSPPRRLALRSKLTAA